MQIRTSRTTDDVAAAVKIDQIATSSHTRAQYIAAVAERGVLNLAYEQGQVVGFCCLDESYFFERAFVSLLIVDQDFRRRGIGQRLIQDVAIGHTEIWTSTNRSNVKMRGLLSKLNWHFCGELVGLDVGDPELYFKKSD